MLKTQIKYATLAAIVSMAAAQVATAQDAGNTNDVQALEEIVVTATKRNESLVKVPVSVSVFTEQAIIAAGIERPADFLASTPNVTFIEDNSGEAYINIRGQTSVRNSDPNVAIVIDGVTLSSVKPFNQDLFGIQQIEILKGPQSALYGRNAAAGAIVITTIRPGDEMKGSVTVGRGNFNTSRATGSVSGPITDSLKFGISGSMRNTDGPFTNQTTGEKVNRFQSSNGRARLLYEPDDRLAVDFQVGGHRSKGGSTAYNAQIVGLPLGGFPGTALDANNADMPFLSNITGIFDERFTDALLKVEYDFDFAKLTSISSASHLNQYYGSDSPPYIAADAGLPGSTNQQYNYVDKNYSQEIRLTSPSDQRLRWQAGFYILRFLRDQPSKINADRLGALPANRREIEPANAAQPTLSYSRPLFETTSYAPFASLQYDVTDALHLNVAGRYDTEKRSVQESAPDMVNPLTGQNYNNCIQLTGVALEDCHDSRTFKQFEPKVSLSYDVAPTASVYASYGKGFKSGGFNPIGARGTLLAAAAAAGLPASSVYVKDGYDKEVSTSYEVGAKARLFDRRLTVNAALFQTRINGAQQFEFFPTAGIQTTVSIDEVKLKGFDIDFDAQLPTGLRIFGGYGYTDGEVSKFAGNAGFVGNVAPGAFKYTLNLGATQTFEINPDFDLVPRVEFNRYGSIWFDAANTAGTRRDPLNIVNGRLTLKSADSWEVSLYGDNLFNKKYFQVVVPLLGSFTVNYRGPTRTYGIEARLTF